MIMMTLNADNLARFTESVSQAGFDTDDFEIRADYSGRSMYGSTCLGIVSHDSSLTSVLTFELAAALAEENDMDDLRCIYHEMAGCQQTDSMGQGSIVYWPGIQVDTTTD